MKKFQLDSADGVSIVLEEDGTCVDEEEYFQHGLESNNVLMLLKSDETWTGIQHNVDSMYGTKIICLSPSTVNLLVNHGRTAGWAVGHGHGPPKILIGWAIMHLASPIIGLYV